MSQENKITLEITENQREIIKHLMFDKIEEAKRNGAIQAVKIWQKHFSDILLNGDMSKWSEV